MSRQAVILAGGKGTRLAERLGGLPKPLVDVDGVPLLARQFEVLRRHGFDRVLLLVNHGAERIVEFCGTPAAAGLDVRLIDDGEPRGTAGALLAAWPELDPRFLVVYGDTLFDVDLDRLCSEHQRSSADATLMLHPNDHPQDSDLVELSADGWVTAFHGYPHPPDAMLPNLVNAALYVIERPAIEFWRARPAPTDIAKQLFPAMIAAGKRVRGYVSFEYIKDIGTPKRLDKAVGHLRRGVIERSSLRHRQKAVFIDRDGTLNESAGYVTRPDQLRLLPGAARAIRRLNDAEYRVVLTTNQPVIARGECTVEGLRRIHDKMETELGREGAFIDRIYVCPHHPDGGYPGEVAALKIRCDCRKPATGLVDAACAELNVDREASWFIGDTTTDMLTARRAGLRAILVRTGEAGGDGKYDAQPDFTVDDLPAAIDLIAAAQAAAGADARGGAGETTR